MKILRNIGEYNTYFKDVKAAKKSIGFVPTMGALHKGHISLIHCSRANTDVTICSIFVNPTQFNDKDDYLNYPRNIESDLDKLEKASTDAVFIPAEKEMYSEEYKAKSVKLEHLEEIMEGAYRPGHFSGVITIVQRLFDIIKPDKSYFGEKDYQQLTIIKEMAQQLEYSIEIVGCPIIRENDGLAMSSRNQLLTKPQRVAAPAIYSALLNARDNFNTNEIAGLKSFVEQEINKEPTLQIEYVEICDAHNLQPITNKIQGQQAICCLAVFAGKIRLIDNMPLNM